MQLFIAKTGFTHKPICAELFLLSIYIEYNDLINSIRSPNNEQIGFLQERNPIRGMAKCWNSWNSYNKQDCIDYIQFILLFAILQQGTELTISSIESNGDPHGL